MNENEQAWLAVLRAIEQHHIDKAPKRHRLWTPQCPSVPRFVSNPRWSEQEREHMKDCAYCQMTLRLVEQEERREQNRIVTPNDDLECQTTSPADARNQAISFFQLAAKTARIDQSGNEAGLDWRLVEDGGELLFRVNATDKELEGRHVAFTLHGGEGTSVGGVLTLQPDEAGYFVGSTTFRREELAAALAGECRGIEVKLQSNGTA